MKKPSKHSARAAERRRRAEDDELGPRVQQRTAELAEANEALRSEITGHKRAEEDIQDLSKFPSENPNPVLRIARDGTLLYVNEAGLTLLPQWHLEVGETSPPMLAGGVAHDFNNLLTIINGTAELAAMDLREDDPLRREFDDICRAGDRAAALTRQLLAFSRKQVMKLEVLNLSTLVGSMQGMLQRLIGEHLALVVRPAEHLGSVLADPSQIEQVVMNLAINARDAMPDGGTLTIETLDVALDAAYAADHPSVQPGPHVMLAVSDTGVGMEEATQKRIFEPFFTTKERGKGTGLGLSTVYGIVKQSGGSIWVYSEPGRGTAFKVYLPRIESVALPSPAARTATSAHGTETILIVEDEAGVCHLAERVLRTAGYTVLTASNGPEALVILERHDGPVHLVLTDMVMPGMSGRDLSARIVGISPQMKILYSSGYTDEVILRDVLFDKAAHFIGKPYGAAELTRRVRELLDTSN